MYFAIMSSKTLICSKLLSIQIWENNPKLRFLDFSDISQHPESKGLGGVWDLPVKDRKLDLNNN